MSQINTDNINLGSNNKFITNGIINSDLYVFGTLTVNRLQVLGVDLDKKMTLNEYIDDILQETSNTIFNTINEYDNRIEYLNNIISNTSNEIINYIKELDNNMSNYVREMVNI